jgi:hypothetical protein
MSVRTARRQKLGVLIAESGGVAPLARRAGVSEKYLRQILSGFQGPRDRKPRELGERIARRLESACDRPDGWMDEPQAARGRASRGAAVVAVPAASAAPGPDEIWIPRHDGVYPRMGAGDGAMLDGNEVVTMVKASTTGLRQRLGPTPHTGMANLRLVTAHGDSMRGTFEEGDLLLVDTGVNEVRGDGVYVLRGPDALLIKRVQKRGDGSWLLLSDNPLYPPDPVPREAREQYRVLGRVLLAWATRTV